MVINTGAFMGVFFLGPGDAHLYGVLVFFSGIGLGATLAIPSAMQADVIDYDELLSGQRREGQYIGIWRRVLLAQVAYAHEWSNFIWVSNKWWFRW